MGGGKTAEQCFNRWHAEYSEQAALEQHQQHQQQQHRLEQQQQQQAQARTHPSGGERENLYTHPVNF